MPNTLSINADVIQTIMGDEILPDLMETVFEPYQITEAFYKATIKGGRDLSRLTKESMTAKAGMRVSANGGADGARMITTEFFRQGVEVLPLIGTVNTDASTVKTITNTPVENYTQARFGLNFKFQPVDLTEQQYILATAKGGSQSDREDYVASLLGAKLESGMKTILRQVESDICGTNTNRVSGILSLSAAGASTGTYGSIDRSVYTTWQGNNGTYTTGNLDDPSDPDYLPVLLKSIISTLRNNLASISNLCIYAATDIHDLLSNIYTGLGFDTTNANIPGNWRFQIDNGKGVPGWEGLSVNMVPVIPVTKMPTGKFAVVDHSKTTMVGVAGAMFDTNPEWKIGEDSTVEWNRIRLFSQVVSLNPRTLAVYTAG